MKLTSARRAMALSMCTLAILGCEEFEGLTGANSEAEAEAVTALGPDGPRTELRDVERADIFSVTENALWDGRPSLGGVWVAHPDVTDPERVKITNAKTGRTIDGALFRRERSNPGPRIQVSSDAAASLGMLAGQPAELKIIVVRQEEIEIEPQPLPIAEDADTETPETEETPSDDSTVAAATTAAGIAAAADGAPPQRKGFWARFRDSLRNEPKEEAPLDATGGAATATTTESADVPAVETETLDPVTTAAAAAITAAETETADPEEQVAASGSTLKNPFIQVGLFSQEENASAAAASLRQAGIVPQIRGQQSGDGTLWRVFVGPMTSTEDQAALLRRVRDLGYADAFLAPN